MTNAAPDSSPPLPDLPRRFGRYTLFDFIGKGGMAEIFLSRAHTELGAVRLVVIKQILPQFAESPQFAEMLIHEAKLAARLDHAHIAKVLDLGRASGKLFIAMEYVEGLDLNALLRRCSQDKVPMPFEFAVGIVASVLRGLDYAHRRLADDGKPLGIVHRDVSPSNVLVSLEGEVKLCDFGIAHANDLVQVPAVADEAIKGKSGYMSPEHARGEPIDARSDVFAAGILLWELASGRRMYKPSSDVPLLEQAKRAEIPDLVMSDLPAGEKLQKIVARALAVDREKRFPTAAAMLRELETYMMEAHLGASPLRLGEWITTKFGEEVTNLRRAREHALVSKSVPPPPESEMEEAGPPSSSVPRAAAVPMFPVSQGAMRAFREDTAGVVDAIEAIAGPSSLTGAAMDLAAGPPSSSQAPIAQQNRAGRARVLVIAAFVALLIVLLIAFGRRR